MQGEGFELLNQAMAEMLGQELFEQEICLTPADAKLRAVLYELGGVRGERFSDNGDMLLQVRMQQGDFRMALSRAGVSEHRFFTPEREDWER